MSSFTEKDRNNTLEKIVHFLKNHRSVLSVILVGSGATGFTDRYSDLDFAVVIDDDANADEFLSEYQNFPDSEFDIMINHRVWGRPLVSAVLNNYLEIDASAVYTNQLRASRKAWKVLVDKTRQAETLMKKSYDEGQEGRNHEQIDQKYNSTVWSFRQYIMYAIIAVNRNDLWSAHWEMQYIRDLAIKLSGCKLGLETKRNRDVKLFPEDIKEKLIKTLPIGFNQREYALALKNLIYIIYNIFQEHYGENLDFPKERMINLYELILGEKQ